MDESKVRGIIGRLLDPLRAQEQIAEGASVGEADVLVARYGVPDTNVPHGLDATRVTDRTAFDGIISEYTARSEQGKTIPFFLDHGYAHLHPPFAESNMKIGKTRTLRSEQDGLVGGMEWNLAKESARDAFADAVFDPYGTRFSYRWNDDETYRGADGLDHESRIGQIVEISQLGLSSAQQDTWVFPESVKMRTSVHHTDFVQDGNIFVPKDFPADLLRMGYAAMDIEGDPADPGTYRFPHHKSEGDLLGAAIIPVCEQIVDDLNKMRGEPEDQRVAAYRHLANHIKDAGKAPPKLRAQRPTLEEFSEMLEDPGFAKDINDLMRAVAPESAMGMRRHMGGSLPNGHGKDKDDIAEMSMESLARRHQSIHDGDDAPHSHGQRSEGISVGELLKARTGEVIQVLLDEADFRDSFQRQLREAEELQELADPARWYTRTWQTR